MSRSRPRRSNRGELRRGGRRRRSRDRHDAPLLVRQPSSGITCLACRARRALARRLDQPVAAHRDLRASMALRFMPAASSMPSIGGSAHASRTPGAGRVHSSATTSAVCTRQHRARAQQLQDDRAPRASPGEAAAAADAARRRQRRRRRPKSRRRRRPAAAAPLQLADVAAGVVPSATAARAACRGGRCRARRSPRPARRHASSVRAAGAAGFAAPRRARASTPRLAQHHGGREHRSSTRCGARRRRGAAGCDCPAERPGARRRRRADWRLAAPRRARARALPQGGAASLTRI